MNTYNLTSIKFHSDELSICQRCITELIKFGKINTISREKIFSPSDLINIYREEILEFNFEYELTSGKYSIDRRPSPPEMIDIATIKQQAEHELTKNRGLLDSFKSFFNKKIRTENLNNLINKKLNNAKIEYIKLFNTYKKDTLKFHEKRKYFQESKSTYIETKNTEWLDEVIHHGGECIEILGKIAIPITSETYELATPTEKKKKAVIFHASNLAKIIRASHHHIISHNNENHKRLTDIERSKINIEIISRDHGECCLCGVSSKYRNLQVHHIIHLKFGGTHHANNLITLCESCHNKQHGFSINKKPRTYTPLRHGGTFIALDIETTGFSLDDEIIEIAAIKFKNGKPLRFFGGLISIRGAIPKKITHITGITNDMLKNKPSIDVILPKFIRFIENYEIVAHNKSFDQRFLASAARKQNLHIKNDFIDTLKISRTKIPNLKNHKLQTIANYFDLTGINYHRARDDALTTGIIYIKLLNTKKTK